METHLRWVSRTDADGVWAGREVWGTNETRQVTERAENVASTRKLGQGSQNAA